MDICLCRLNRVALVMNWRSRTREIINLVHLYRNRVRNIMAKEFEILVVHQFEYIGLGASEEIVNAKYVMPRL